MDRDGHMPFNDPKPVGPVPGDGANGRSVFMSERGPENKEAPNSSEKPQRTNDVTRALGSTAIRGAQKGDQKK
jgi:hypothetical protein